MADENSPTGDGVSGVSRWDWYFDGKRPWLKVARFLNLLEPDRPVLDLTKVVAWGSTVSSFIAIHGGDITQIVASHAMTAASWAKHEVRRKTLTEKD